MRRLRTRLSPLPHLPLSALPHGRLSWRARSCAFAAAVFIAAVTTLFGAPAVAVAAPLRAPDGLCTTSEWQNPTNFQACVDRMKIDLGARLSCLDAPTPSTPDSGMAGWFASRPASSRLAGPQGYYSDYGYAGYDFTTYDLKCASLVTHPNAEFENTVASGEFLIATSVTGASNALRERAWDPGFMWGWADPLVEKATKAVYTKVFTVFGSITLAVVGMYLLWRSRQSDLSNAVTTAGWAILVMVLVTAIASWPKTSAGLADKTLTTSLGVIHGAVGPPDQSTPPDQCRNPDPNGCIDHRPPAVRASDTATEGMLYRNWLRGTLGSADSDTAKKYGPVLYDAKSFTWDETEKIRQDARVNPDSKLRQTIIDEKAQRWMKVAERIKTEDPEAYEYLQGTRGMERIGAGFIAILASLFFALFDITASVLVLLGFLLFRWAVIAAPILGTLGLLRPASSGLRRLANAVVAAIFNIIIFGTGSAIYLFAVNLILDTPSLAGWLQVVLIWLTGVVGWLLLRPYRRITQLGGKDSTETLTSAGSWHRLFLRDVRQAATLKVVDAGGTNGPAGLRGREALETRLRPESRTEDVVMAGASAAGRPEQAAAADARPSTRPRRGSSWEEPDVHDDAPPSFTIYRPDSDRPRTAPPRTDRSPARRPESATLPR
jgi:hypothetical protein